VANYVVFKVEVGESQGSEQNKTDFTGGKIGRGCKGWKKRGLFLAGVQPKKRNPGEKGWGGKTGWGKKVRYEPKRTSGDEESGKEGVHVKLSGPEDIDAKNKGGQKNGA